jgi:hypothetical protein
MAKFATLYSRYANATRAAIEAGYSERSAASTGSKLLKHSKVQALVGAHHVNREVHAEETYRTLINLGNAALKLVADSMGDPNATLRDKATALESAGRAWERLAKCDGLMVERHRIEGSVSFSLQDLVARVSDWKLRNATAALAAPARLIDAVVVDPPSPDNGNGNGNGNGHEPEAKAS